MSITPFLRRVVEERGTLTLLEAAALMRLILDGAATDLELASLFGAMAARGETGREIAGFATAMREVSVTLPLTVTERSILVDTCGTGGDASGTFNISTGAALVAAAAGATVAKHGNRAITSRCGSADVLEALGVPTQLSPEDAVHALRTHRFCFLLAPAHHPTMKALLPVRRALGVRTVLHVLGPLLNPAGARRQVMGIYAARMLGPVAEALTLLDTVHAKVVHGEADVVSDLTQREQRERQRDPTSNSIADDEPAGLDELSLSGPSEIAEVRGTSVTYIRMRPEDAGFKSAPLSAFAGGSATTNAAILRSIFDGDRGPHRDIVLLNAAAVLVTANLAKTLAHGIEQAARAIDTGAVTDLLSNLH